MDQTTSQPGSRRLAARLAGAVLLAVTAGIHLDLYITSYRHIPTIGWLFLLQVIVAFALAIAVVVVPGPLAPAAGAGFAIATLGGYLLTLWVGLFNFHEVRTTAGIVAGLVEVAAFGILGWVALASLPRGTASVSDAVRKIPGGAVGAAAGLSVVAVIVLGASVATASSATSGGTGGTASGGGGAAVKVVIKNYKFIPGNPEVKPGERIEVINEDPIDHTFTAGPSQHRGAFDTGLIGAHRAKTITAPQTAGMYPFYCTVHPFMTGMLIVGR
ncbi:MAG TPA: cupredoxin domain-containing protein [Streptosporangiaceae bacterium]|nr:cupredoxin domain-containing protein [Streptosporangiaceae bacterium]